MSEITIKLKRREDGGYDFTVSGEGFAMGGGRPSADYMLDQFEQILEVVEDRVSGGSGML